MAASFHQHVMLTLSLNGYHLQELAFLVWFALDLSLSQVLPIRKFNVICTLNTVEMNYPGVCEISVWGAYTEGKKKKQKYLPFLRDLPKAWWSAAPPGLQIQKPWCPFNSDMRMLQEDCLLNPCLSMWQDITWNFKNISGMVVEQAKVFPHGWRMSHQQRLGRSSCSRFSKSVDCFCYCSVSQLRILSIKGGSAVTDITSSAMTCLWNQARDSDPETWLCP